MDSLSAVQHSLEGDPSCIGSRDGIRSLSIQFPFDPVSLLEECISLARAIVETVLFHAEWLCREPLSSFRSGCNSYVCLFAYSA